MMMLSKNAIVVNRKRKNT